MYGESTPNTIPEIIDATSHIMSHEVPDELDSIRPTAEIDSLRNAPRMFDVEGRLECLDDNGIDRQVINLAAPMVWDEVDPEEALAATRVANNEIRRIADELNRLSRRHEKNHRGMRQLTIVYQSYICYFIPWSTRIQLCCGAALSDRYFGSIDRKA